MSLNCNIILSLKAKQLIAYSTNYTVQNTLDQSNRFLSNFKKKFFNAIYYHKQHSNIYAAKEPIISTQNSKNVVQKPRENFIFVPPKYRTYKNIYPSTFSTPKVAYRKKTSFCTGLGTPSVCILFLKV